MAYKFVSTSVKLGDLLDASPVEELRDEMTEWRDNMDGTGLENTEKFEQVSECADALETIADEIDTAVSSLQDDSRLESILEDVIVYQLQTPKNKRQNPARWARASNAAQALKAAMEHINSKVEGEDEGELEECQTLADQTDELEMLEFPGMF